MHPGGTPDDTEGEPPVHHADGQRLELGTAQKSKSWAVGAKRRLPLDPMYTRCPIFMLEIDITSFQSGVHHVELTPDPDEVDLDPNTFSDVHVLARLDCHRDRILVSLDAHATAELTCDRTQRLYDQPLEGAYQVLFGPEHMVGAESDSFDEVRVLDPTDRTIDVTDLVRDTLLLSVPQRKVAPGAEDEDIQLQFGTPADDDEDAQDDIDPRWEALRELREDTGNSSDE